MKPAPARNGLLVREENSIALAAAQTQDRSHDLEMVKTDSATGTGPACVENLEVLTPYAEGLPHDNAAHLQEMNCYRGKMK